MIRGRLTGALAVGMLAAGVTCGCSALRTPAVVPSQVTQRTTYDATSFPDTSFVQTKFLNVPYATESSSQKLDIYLPEGSGPHPVVIAIHGGGFRQGDKADGQITPMLQALGRGYAVVSIDYRLSGETKWPAQIEDAKAAVRFLREHATSYDLDTSRFAAWGDSAGGDLAALLGTTGGVRSLAGAHPANAEQTDRVQAVVDWFGPIDYALMDAQAKASGVGQPNHDAANSPQSQLFGAPLATIPDKVRASNAMSYITTDDPPFLIEHGTKDRTIPVAQSQELAAALTRVLGPEKVTLKLFDGADHMDAVFATADNIDFVLDWLDRQLRRQ